MTDDGRDNAGVIAPPPLIYAIPLLLGLLLKRRIPVPFLPRGAGPWAAAPRRRGAAHRLVFQDHAQRRDAH